MALLMNCWSCNKEFMSTAMGSSFCDDCNGNTEARKKEKERWDGLSNDQKIEELKMRVESLEREI